MFEWFAIAHKLDFLVWLQTWKQYQLFCSSLEVSMDNYNVPFYHVLWLIWTRKRALNSKETSQPRLKTNLKIHTCMIVISLHKTVDVQEFVKICILWSNDGASLSCLSTKWNGPSCANVWFWFWTAQMADISCWQIPYHRIERVPEIAFVQTLYKSSACGKHK